MEHSRQKFLSLWTFFPFYLPYGPKKSKFWKNEHHTWRYYHFTNVYHKWQSHDVWFLRYEMQQTEFLVILDHFLPFYHPNNPKNQSFEKLKKMPGDTIILHMCTINYNRMMYSFWGIKRDGQKFLSFWTFFCLFTPLTTQKIKVVRKWKKSLEILLFYTCVP